MNKKVLEYIDQEEEEIHRASENNELKNVEEDFAKYILIAKNTVEKSKRINIRMNEKDFRKIRVKSIDAGMPYQSLINLLLHQYAEGKIEIKL